MIDGPRDHKLGFTRVLFRIVRSCRLLAIVSYQHKLRSWLNETIVELAIAPASDAKSPDARGAGFVGQIGQIRQSDRPKTTPRDPRGDPLIQSETSEGVSETHSS